MKDQDWLTIAATALANSDILALFATDVNGNILEANAAFLSMTGFSRNQIREQVLPAPAQGAARSGVVRTSLKHRDGRSIPADLRLIKRTKKAAIWFALPAPGASATDGRYRTLVARILELHDEERRRIARELHDTTAQNLAALSMNLTMLGESKSDDAHRMDILAECVSLAEASLKEVRNVSYLVHPPLLDELGLESALRAYIDRFSRRTGVEVKLRAGEPVGRFRSAAESALFRITQESLTNVHLHSGSGKAEITLTKNEQTIELTVRDFGKGIPPHQLDPDNERAGVGIASMHERARQLGGRVEITNMSPGTLIRALIPRT